MPIQQKYIPTSRKYADWVTILTLEPILAKAYKKSGLPQSSNPTEQLHHLLGVIVAETAGDSLQREESIFMNSLSEAIVHHWTHA